MKKPILGVMLLCIVGGVNAVEMVKVSVFAGLNDKSPVPGFKIIDHKSNKVIGKTNKEGYFYAELPAGTKLRFFDQKYGASHTISTVTANKKEGFEGYWDPVATWWPFPRPVFSDDVTRVLPPDLSPEPPLPKIPNKFGWKFPVPPSNSWSVPKMDLQIPKEATKSLAPESVYSNAAAHNMSHNRIMYVHESRPIGFWD